MYIPCLRASTVDGQPPADVKAPPAKLMVENSTFFYIPFLSRSSTHRASPIGFVPRPGCHWPKPDLRYGSEIGVRFDGHTPE